MRYTESFSDAIFFSADLCPLSDTVQFLIFKVFANSNFIDGYRICNDSGGFLITVNISNYSHSQRFLPCNQRSVGKTINGLSDMYTIVGSLFPWSLPCRLCRNVSVRLGSYIIQPCQDFELFNSILTIIAQRHGNSTYLSAFPAHQGYGFSFDVSVTDEDEEIPPVTHRWSLHTKQLDASHAHSGLTKDLRNLKVFVCIGHYFRYFRKNIRIVMQNSFVLLFTCKTDVIERKTGLLDMTVDDSHLNRYVLYVFLTLSVLVLFLGVIKVSWPGKRWC